MNKKKLIFIILPLIVIVGIVLAIVFSRKQKTPPQKPIVTQAEPLTIEEMPFVSLFPKDSLHRLVIKIANTQNADSLEYELIYDLKNNLTRGATGEIELSPKGEGEKDILLGTCSSGTCKYDEGITSGELTISLKNDNKLRSFTVYFTVLAGGQEQTSKDDLFSIKVPKTTSEDYILLEGGGLPKKLAEQKLLSGPYQLTSSAKKETISLQKPSEGRLLLWQEGEWTDVENFENAPLGTYVIIE